MAKSPDAFRTISEVADWLGTQAHVLRFWESKFKEIAPVKRAGGRRYYRPEDMLLIGGIKQLLHEDGMTIKGAQKLIAEQGVEHVMSLSASIDGAQKAEPQPEPAPEPDTSTPAANEDVLAQETVENTPQAEVQDLVEADVEEQSDNVIAFTLDPLPVLQLPTEPTKAPPSEPIRQPSLFPEMDTKAKPEAQIKPRPVRKIPTMLVPTIRHVDVDPNAPKEKKQRQNLGGKVKHKHLVSPLFAMSRKQRRRHAHTRAEAVAELLKIHQSFVSQATV